MYLAASIRISLLVKMKRERYVWVTLVPTAWLLVTTLTAGIEKIFHSDPRIGFLALANRFSEAAAQGKPCTGEVDRGDEARRIQQLSRRDCVRRLCRAR